MMAAGSRDRLISFHSLEAIENSFGEPVDNQIYPLLGEEWAAVFYGKGTERREAAAKGADQPATFVVLANATTRAVSTAHLIQYDGAFWDIAGTAKLGRSEIEFTATRRAA